MQTKYSNETAYCYYSTCAHDQARGLQISLNSFHTYPGQDAQLITAARALLANAGKALHARESNYGRAVALAILEGDYNRARSIEG